MHLDISGDDSNDSNDNMDTSRRYSVLYPDLFKPTVQKPRANWSIQSTVFKHACVMRISKVTLIDSWLWPWPRDLGWHRQGRRHEVSQTQVIFLKEVFFSLYETFNINIMSNVYFVLEIRSPWLPEICWNLSSTGKTNTNSEHNDWNYHQGTDCPAGRAGAWTGFLLPGYDAGGSVYR